MSKRLADYLDYSPEQFYRETLKQTNTGSSSGGGSGSVAWGAISGSITNQSDLQSALNAKEPTIAAGSAGTFWKNDKTWAVPDTLYTANGSTPGARTVTLGGNLTFSGNQVAATKFFAQAVGSSTTVYPLEILNSGGTTPLLRVNEAGTIMFGNNSNASLTSAILTFGAQLATISSSNSSTNIGSYITFAQSASTASAAGQVNHVSLTQSFSPSSGGTIYAGINIAHIINQTSTANGVTRGILINPTITNAVDYRAFEAITGKIVLGASTVAANFADDTAAATGGIPIGGVYHTTGAMKIRRT